MLDKKIEDFFGAFLKEVKRKDYDIIITSDSEEYKNNLYREEETKKVILLQRNGRWEEIDPMIYILRDEECRRFLGNY